MTTISPITNSEMERRWSLVRDIMETHDIDAIVMQAREDWMGGYVRWFTDNPAGNGYPRTVIFYKNAPMTVVEMGAFGTVHTLKDGQSDHRGVKSIYATPSFISIHQTGDYDAELVCADLLRHGVSRIGTPVLASMPYSIVEQIKNKIPNAQLIDISDPLDAVKAIKSVEEIGLIKKIAKLQDDVFAETCDFFRAGISDRDVMAHAEAVGRRLGSDQGIYLGASSPQGKPSRFVGRHYQNRIINDADHLSMLIEINGPGGIYLEIARTMVLGKANDHILQAFENVRKSQDYSLSLMKPGAAPADIFNAHNAWMTEQGLPEETRLYAHGQGCEMVERPLIRQDETLPLAEGMLLAVHPGYDDGKVFAVVCDNYLVERDGMSDCLHQTEKKIFEL